MNLENRSHHAIEDDEPLKRWVLPIDPPDPRVLVERALARIDEQGQIAYQTGDTVHYRLPGDRRRPTERMDDMTWAELAAEIAFMLYGSLRETPEPDDRISRIGMMLCAYRHDPALIEAALSLIQPDEDGDYLNPTWQMHDDWQYRLGKMRQK